MGAIPFFMNSGFSYRDQALSLAGAYGSSGLLEPPFQCSIATKCLKRPCPVIARDFMPREYIPALYLSQYTSLACLTSSGVFHVS